MKRISLYITLLCITFSASVTISFAATSTRSPNAPIAGEIPADTTGAGNAGTGIFNWEATVLPPISGTGEVYVDTGDYFHGNFFLHELGDGTSNVGNPGWTTFNICQEQESGATPNPSVCTIS